MCCYLGLRRLTLWEFAKEDDPVRREKEIEEMLGLGRREEAGPAVVCQQMVTCL